MTFKNIEIKRENSIKYLGIIIDENLTWENHIEVIENKISKNIGVLYRASHFIKSLPVKPPALQYLSMVLPFGPAS